MKTKTSVAAVFEQIDTLTKQDRKRKQELS